MGIIAVSRGASHLGKIVAQKVAEELGYTCLGRELVAEAARKLGVSPELMDAKIEEAPTVWERLTSERRIYVMGMQAALAEHLRKGDLVYHSYAGHLLMTGVPGLLKVRVIAPVEVRMARVMEEMKASREEAAEYVAKVDDQRARWTRFIYGVDWRDSSQYDLILNLATMLVEVASKAIAGVAQSAEFSQPKDGAAKISDFILASRVRLALAADGATRSIDLQVVAADGVVAIRGKAPQLSMPLTIGDAFEKEVSKIALGVAGVKGVQLDLRPSGPVLTD